MIDDLASQVDFILAFAVVHELPDPEHFYRKMHRALRAGGTLLVAEPRLHVSLPEFKASMGLAARAGFRMPDGPVIKASRCAVLER
jgi:SAM-dependent methyltransferase